MQRGEQATAEQLASLLHDISVTGTEVVLAQPQGHERWQALDEVDDELDARSVTRTIADRLARHQLLRVAAARQSPSAGCDAGLRCGSGRGRSRGGSAGSRC